MSNIKECDKCNKKIMYTQYQRNKWLCNECLEFNNDVKEVIESLPKEKNEVIVKYIIPKSKTLKIKENKDENKDAKFIDYSSWEDWSALWLTCNLNVKLYTANELNKKFKKDYNSIKNEKICIKYWDRYILHSDIIEQFKTNLNTDGNT